MDKWFVSKVKNIVDFDKELVAIARSGTGIDSRKTEARQSPWNFRFMASQATGTF